jgi:hypothetical protein
MSVSVFARKDYSNAARRGPLENKANLPPNERKLWNDKGL